MYKYNFNKENCWYKNICDGDKTNSCNEYCLRYMEMDYMIETSKIPKGKQFKNKLIASNEDIQAFKFLNDIKNDIVNFINNRRKSLYI